MANRKLVLPDIDNLPSYWLNQAASQLSDSKPTPNKSFAKQYRNDPVAFAHDCFRWDADQGPAPYQDEIMALLIKKKRVAVRGCHGLGKTSLASWLVLFFSLTRDAEGTDWKMPTTASAWRHLHKFLWPEISKWAKRIRWDKIGREPFDPRREHLTLSLRLNFGEAFAAASDTPELLEGAHADSLFYLFDESKSIPDATFDAAEGAFSGAGKDTKNEAFALAISTPGEPIGRFYDIHTRKPGFRDWFVRHVKVEEAIAAGRISKEWVDNRKAQWGETSSIYKNRVLGEFAESDSEGIIPLSWVEAAQERWQQWFDAGAVKGEFTGVGVDVATGGEDKTIMALRYEKIITELREFAKADTMETAGRVVGILNAYGGMAIIDVGGVGAGVVHRVREQKKDVIAFNGTEKTNDTDLSGEIGFINRRAGAWYHMRELLDPTYNHNIMLPPDDKLTGDLVSAHQKEHSSGKVQIESKLDIKARLRRSPDSGDAVVMAFALDDGPELPFGWIHLPEGAY
ncbi:MAG: hypothetical protein Q7K03_08410 [Dehalococcoidia bacterium]|nr:hypothetical protein [Dehalococcoidia bacterium]